MDTHHRGQRTGLAALTMFGVMGFDFLLQFFPWNQLIHLRQKLFSACYAALVSIFGFGKADLIHGLILEKD